MKKAAVLGLSMFTLISLLLLGACTEPAPAPAPTPAPSPAPTPPADVIELRYSCPMPPTSIPNFFGTYFLDYIEEKSGGGVKFERFAGGVLAGPFEHLQLASSGGVDVIVSGHQDPPELVPLHNVMPSFIPGSSQAALDFVQTMEWDTPETATILQKEWEDINLKLLAYSAAGENGIVAKEVFESLDDLDGKKLGGSGTTGPAWAKKGVTQITVQFPDIYESLSRGVIDMTTMSLGAIVDMKWYEVTSVYMTYGTYPYSAPIMVNLDVWNGLPPDIQQLFMDAAQAAKQFSLEYDAETTISSKQLFEDAGLEVGALPEEEQEWLYREFMQIWKADNMALAEKAGKLKEAEIIWEHSEKLVNEILAK